MRTSGGLRLSSVHTYPVKSCRRVDRTAAVRVEPWGLAGDRRWMVVDGDGTLVSQREVAALARVRPTLVDGGELTLRAEGMPDLGVASPRGPLTRATVHGSTVAATPAGREADEWFTTVTGHPVRLVWLDDPTRRPVHPSYGGPDDRVSFADAHPLLLTNAASLDALNGWMRESGSREAPLPMSRFRPNLVISGAQAWAEDAWIGHRMRIGEATFRVAKPCGRCVVTTTDQETGARGQEPLRTLARHRSIDGRLVFGVLLNPDPPYGRLAPGDPVVSALPPPV